jgi:hypothetical protein
MQYQFRPIHEWPGEKTKIRRRSTFSASWSRTLIDLDRELQHLKAEGLIIQAAVKENEIRLDGMLRSDARPTWPGVILSFESKIGPLSYPCDTYIDWQANVRAIALALAALRAVDRYGVTRRAEQYKGWARLEAPTPRPNFDTAQWAMNTICEVVGVVPYNMGTNPGHSCVDELYRRAIFKTHPDHGGNADSFRKVQEAKVVLDKWLAERR